MIGAYIGTPIGGVVGVAAVHDAAATFAGAGSFSANVSRHNKVGYATFAGVGALSAAARQGMRAAVQFAGAGNLSALMRQGNRAFATLPGNSTLSAHVTQSQPVHATFAGAGAFSARATVGGAIAATFAGSGLLVASALQVAVLFPDADSSAGDWLTDQDTTPLFPAIDEYAANDADYIKSTSVPEIDICKISLSDPAGSALMSPVTVSYRYKKTGGSQADLKVRLLQGTTEIAAWTHSDIAASFVTADQELSAGQVAAVTDWTNLFLEFTGPSLP